MQFPRNAYASIGPLYLDCSVGFTFEICFRVASLYNNPTLFEFSDDNSRNMLSLQLKADRSIICEMMYEKGESVQRQTIPVIRDSRWHYLVFTIDGEGIWRIYLDGQPVEWDPSQRVTNLPYYAVAGRPASGLRTHCLIGRGVDSRQFHGGMAMIRCWNTALDSRTIQQQAQEPTQHIKAVVGDYDRSLLAHLSGPYLMRGHLDWGTRPDVDPEAQVLHRLQTEGGIIVQSHQLRETLENISQRRALERKLHEAYTARLQALEELKRAEQLAAAQVIDAERSKQSMVADARTRLSQMEQDADASIQQEKARAVRQRAESQQKLHDERQHQRNRVTSQRTGAEQIREDADTESAVIEVDKRREADGITTPARSKLQEARRERSEHP